MAEKVVSTLKNKIKFETDQQSLKRVRNQIKSLKKEMEGLSFSGGGGSPSSSRGNTPSSQRPQKTFEQHQKRVIENFKLSTAAVRSLSKEQLKASVNVLKTAENREQLVDLVRKEKFEAKKIYDEQKRINKEMQKGNLIRKRAVASTEQMVGTLGSAYLAVDSLNSIMQTGMKFEAFEKAFLAVSDGPQAAVENMQFAREQAMRLGTDLIEGGKAYARMLGAAGTNTPVEQIRETFVAVSEISTAMSLTTDDQMGVYKAR